jgi:denticleless
MIGKSVRFIISPCLSLGHNLYPPEPPRAILHPHSNGIFDIKWNHADSRLATCSGDQSTRIFCPTTTTITNVLRGHDSTVKCIAWDPDHSDLLSTGGRDGTICVWDLRVGKRQSREGVDAAVGATSPVLVIPSAGKDAGVRRRRGKCAPLSKSVTSLAYPCGEPYRLISSESSDGYVI